MEILITGKRGKLYRTVAAALASRRGPPVLALPVSSRLFEIARKHSLRGIVFTVSREQEIEPLRWLLRQNHSLPVAAVLPRRDRKLCEQLLQEGVYAVAEISGLNPSQIRQRLGRLLRPLSSKHSGADQPTRLAQESLHVIRSALTAILGNAEMALKNSPVAAARRKQLQQILRGVAEIEKNLRLLERVWKARPSPPQLRR